MKWFTLPILAISMILLSSCTVIIRPVYHSAHPTARAGRYQFFAVGSEIYRGDTATGEIRSPEGDEISATAAPFARIGRIRDSDEQTRRSRPDPAQPVEGQGKLRIIAYIDGSDVLKIRGNRLWYEHRNFQKPGKLNGADEPTFINGKPWKPIWIGDKSEPLVSGFPNLPALTAHGDHDFGFKIHRARGNVSTLETPSAQNDRTWSILFDDDTPLGADWYDISLVW